MNKTYLIKSLFLLALLALNALGYADGTLIVSYQTGPKAERIERVRFWLKNERQEIQMYPKGSCVVDDKEFCTRTVVIEDLVPGKYVLEFLMPNKDGLFEDVAPKELLIVDNKTLKIDQSFKPRYGTIRARVEFVPQDNSHEAIPTIMLMDKQGKLVAQSNSGMLEANHLMPDDYTVTFEELEGYKSPQPISFQLHPKEDSGFLIGRYFKIQKLILSQ